MSIAERYRQQQFANDYRLVDGARMHAENPRDFQVPPDVIKQHVAVGQFVELRIDSPRFSVHEADAAECFCPSCNGQLSKPILRHLHPAALVAQPPQEIPSRGWGEDFWVRVTERAGDWLCGRVDNRLVEGRLHGVGMDDELAFHQDHILAVHDIHRGELVAAMDADALRALAAWLSSQRAD